jgi:hypothetical protein
MLGVYPINHFHSDLGNGLTRRQDFDQVYFSQQRAGYVMD